MKVSMDNLRNRVREIDDLLKETEELIGGAKCISCNRVFSTLEDIKFIKEYGMCIMCDSIRQDANRDMYEEIHNDFGCETSEDKLRTDAYIERGE